MSEWKQKCWPPTSIHWVKWYAKRPRDTQHAKNLEAIRVALRDGIIRPFDGHKGDINRNHWQCQAAHALGLIPVHVCPANGSYYFCSMGGGLDFTIPSSRFDTTGRKAPKGPNWSEVDA
jgi:hypothetical protein